MAFGFGGLGLCLLVFPLIILFTRDKVLRSYRVRSVIRGSFKFFLWSLQFLRILRIDAQGLDKLSHMQGKLVICNHPSLIDVIILVSYLKNIQCIVNNKLWNNFFVGGIVRAADYIRNDTDPEVLLQRCQDMLGRGENLVIFPEGTRSVPGKPMKFYRGFANLALCAGVDIQALTLVCKPIMLIKGAKWYQIPPRRSHYILRVGPQFNFEDYNDEIPRSLRVRKVMRDVENFYLRSI